MTAIQLAMWALSTIPVYAVLIVLLVYGVTLQPSSTDFVHPTRAGKAAGGVLFVIAAILMQPQMGGPQMDTEQVSLSAVYCGIAFVTCGVASWAIHKFLGRRITGITAMMTIASSLTALLALLLVDGARAPIVCSVLGGTIGALIESMCFERGSPEARPPQDPPKVAT